MDIEGKPGKAFYPEEEGVPSFDELILVTRSDRAADPRLAWFLTAIEKAAVYIVNHPDDAWELFKNSNPDTLDNELNRRAWKDTLRRFALRPAALDSRRYNRFARFMMEKKLISKVPPLGDYAIMVE